MIDIIIPCYNAHNTLEITLNSIINQSIKDKINVLLVDDCSDNNYHSIVSKYRKYININELRLEANSGPGVARQTGIENTNNKYVVFIDSDDLFFDVDSLKHLYDSIEAGYDYVNSLEYDQKRGEIILLNGNVHGKIYRREYLEKNNISFNKTRIHEDNYFNNMVILTGANLKEIDDCTYFYYCNPNSITNSNSKEFDNIEVYLQNMKELNDIINNKKCSVDRIIQYKKDKYKNLYYMYQNINQEEKTIFKDLINKYDKDFIQFIDLGYNEFVYHLYKYLEIIKSTNE